MNSLHGLPGRLRVSIASRIICSGALLLTAAWSLPAASADGLQAPAATPQITRKVDESSRVQRPGNVRREAVPANDQGALADDAPLQHLWLQLKRSPAREQAFTQRIEAMQTKGSPLYHQWLTAEQVGELYGPAQQDIATVTRWLGSHGFTVNQITPSRMVIDFSGDVGQVKETFGTEIHRFKVGSEMHFANTRDPSIPAALDAVVVGPVSLSNFFPKPLVHKMHLPVPKSSSASARPDVTEPLPPESEWPASWQGALYLVGPTDFNTIYDVQPAWNANLRGAGQRIVVVEDVDMQPADWTSFRHSFGLDAYAGTLSIVHPAGYTCTDPGMNLAESEAALDAEWSGAVAPDASIEVASCADSDSEVGFLTAAQNLVNGANPPQIISMSYGISETDLESDNLSWIGALWQQAAAEGISVFVSSGDSGSSGQDDQEEEYATHGFSVSGLASSPYVTAVGGTDFSDVSSGATTEPPFNTLNPSTSSYWGQTNSASGLASVLSYVPEMTWNNSCASPVVEQFYNEGVIDAQSLCNEPLAVSTEGPYSSVASFSTAGGSGGKSTYFTKPTWQAQVYGYQNDGYRDLPDVSLFSAGEAFYHGLILCMSDASEYGTPCDYSVADDVFNNVASGTSFAAPAMAGIQALLNQAAGSAQGNINADLYALAQQEYGTPTVPNNGSSGATLLTCNASNGTSSASGCVFHDITLGNNAVPCAQGSPNCVVNGQHASSTNCGGVPCGVLPGYSATAGWDYATGLGSIDVGNLVQAFKPGASSIKATEAFSPSPAQQGAAVKLTVTITDANPVAVVGLKFSDTYPGGFGNDTSSGHLISDSCGGVVTFSSSGMALASGAVPANGSCSVVVDVIANNIGIWSDPLSPITSDNAPALTGVTASLSIIAPKQPPTHCPHPLNECM
jgi:subtilase family serine protease